MDKKSYCSKCNNLIENGLCVYNECIYTEEEIAYKMSSCKDNIVCIARIISTLIGLTLITLAAVWIIDI